MYFLTKFVNPDKHDKHRASFAKKDLNWNKKIAPANFMCGGQSLAKSSPELSLENIKRATARPGSNNSALQPA